MRTHIYHHIVYDDEARFQRIEQKLDLLINAVSAYARAEKRRDEVMSQATQQAIDELKAEVTPMTDAVISLVTVVDGLVAAYEQAGDDPDEIRAVTTSFRSNRDAVLAAAVKGTGAMTPIPPAPPAE